jgi:two-component system phosphate regulon response regulator PhoB
MTDQNPTRARKSIAEPVDRQSKGHVLVVEDEQDLQDLLRYNLEREGYRVTSAMRGKQALDSAAADLPDLVLLDLMLPGMDGLEVCRALRSSRDTAAMPIVMLTAKGEEADIVTGLELGADDYITKPFSPRVLLARLKAVLRRGAAVDHADEKSVVRVGDLRIDPSRYEVHVGGGTVALTQTEFGIIHLLAERPGRVFTRAQIVQRVQGDHVAVTDRSVDVHVVSLRRKLGACGQYIQTVRGIGYRCEDK